jgi:hypothetical protein
MTKSIHTIPMGWLSELLISSLSYTTLYYLNQWLTIDLTYDLGVSWIYLPAGLRLFLTLIFGLPGAIGIAFSSFLISYYGAFPLDLEACIGIGVISGFAPYLARIFVVKNIHLAPDLGNLSLQKLGLCILIYALWSAGLHQWWFITVGLENAGTIKHFLVMVLGDILGSLLLIAIIKYGIDLLRGSRKTVH